MGGWVYLTIVLDLYDRKVIGWAFDVFFFQHPSMLDYQRAMREKRGRNNLETAFFGVHESSFAAAEQMMRKYLPTQISDTLILEVTEYVGRKVFEEDTRRACSIEKNLDKIPDKPEREGIFYIMVDGAAINAAKGRRRTGLPMTY